MALTGHQHDRLPVDGETARWTFRQAAEAVRALGLVLRAKDAAGEYRVSVRRAHGDAAELAEASAYYTDDLGDAVATAQAMARHGIRVACHNELSWGGQ